MDVMSRSDLASNPPLTLEHDKLVGAHGKFVQVVFEIPHKQHGRIHVTQRHMRVLLEQIGHCGLDSD
jgi:hypothetical protein